MDIEEGQLFSGRYKLIKEKGRGAFGEVWLAHDEQIDLDVAVKIYIALDQRGIDDFKSEYKNSYSLNHPNLLHAYHFDVLCERPFLVMPYCPGCADTLVGATDEKEIWRFIRDVSSGLSYLHSKNILHRDIKPDNILVDKEGNYLITDFGVSTKMKSTLRRNSTRALSNDDISGTIGYMAPELFSKSPDAVKATDIWALGATIYEIINQELPFYGQGGIMLEKGAEIPDLKGSWSEDLRLTVDACLAKETWNRPTAAQLAKYAADRVNGDCYKATWTAVGRPSIAPLTEKERIEVCKKCKNRAFNKDIGMVCGLSGGKPDFYSSCSNMSFDQKEADRIEAKKQAEIEENSDIHGAVAFFLWVGVGGGLLVSTISTFTIAFSRWTDSFFRWYSLIYITFFLFIGVKAIVAFYKRKNNAVALATTYCVMIVVDAIFYLIVGTGNAWVFLRNVIWAGSWLTFLYCSEDVKDICPKVVRKWQGVEIATLASYSAIIFVSILCVIFTNTKSSSPVRARSQSVQESSSAPSAKLQSLAPAVQKREDVKEEHRLDDNAARLQKQEEVKEEHRLDDNAARLQNALRNGDYFIVQQLADAGYSAAYIPLARYYMKTPSTHRLADIYAKKAKSLGLSGAQSIIDDLAALGYYD